MTKESGDLQIRGQFSVGPFTIYAGNQLLPCEEMVVGHAHKLPHLMVMTRPTMEYCPNCGNNLLEPKYEVKAVRHDGSEVVRNLGPFDIVYVRSGVVHSVKQMTPGAIGGFACIFPSHDENGQKLHDPRHKHG